MTTGPNPEIQTQNSPVDNTLTPPVTAAPAAPPVAMQPSTPAPAPVQPAATTPAVPPSPNRGLHSFINSFLSSTVGALAGKAPTKYITDADGRVVPAPVQPTDSLADKGKRLAAHALEGLAAGSQVGPQKSGAAAAAAGLGAGAQAATGNIKATDAKARQEERENAEAAEQKKLRMHEIARGNALTASTWQHMMESEQDRDPSRLQHMGWAKAAEDAGIAVKYVSEEEANQIRQSDPEAAAKYQILPVGMKIVQDSEGQQVLDENGKPKMTGQFALIDGLHDGNIPAPATFVSDLQKYGKFAGLSPEETAGLKSGDDLSMQHFIKLANTIQEGKKKQLQGWEKPEIGWKDGKPLQINSVTGETRDFAPGVTPNVENKPADTDQQRLLREAQTMEAKGKAAEALANAALLSKQLSLAGNNDGQTLTAYADAIKNLPPQSQGILKAVNPGVQLSLLAVATGDADIAKTFPTRTTAKSGQLDAAHATTLVKLLNPDWNTQYYKAVQEATDDMVKGKSHQGILSFGQFLVHANDALQGSNSLARSNSPLLNKPINELNDQILGKAGVPQLMTDIMAARSEWNTFIHSGHAPTKDEVDAGSIIMSDKSTPAQIAGVLGEMGKQAVGRLDQINEGYKTVTHRDWPNLIPAMAKDAASNLGLADMVKKYGSGGTLRGAMGGSGTGQAPTGASNEVYVDGKLTGHVVNNQYVPLSQ